MILSDLDSSKRRALIVLSVRSIKRYRAGHVSNLPASIILMANLSRYSFTIETWLGFMLYGLSGVCWLWVLSPAQLSFAYPVLALSFPIVVALSAVLFGELSPRCAGRG